MTKIWLQEQASRNENNWRGFWANMDYDEALRQVRRDNRKERQRGHVLRYRIRELILEQDIKEVI